MRTCRLTDFDFLSDPAKNVIKIPTSCGVCEEARSRSRSRSKSPYDKTNEIVSDRLSSESLSSSNSDTNFNINRKNNSFSKRATTSLSPVSINRSYEANDPNSTYTMQSRSKSHESFIGSQNDKSMRFSANSSNANQQDYFNQKLDDSEAMANEITNQLEKLKEFLKFETLNPNYVLLNTGPIIKRFEKDRNDLLQLINLYHNINSELKDVFFEMKNDFKKCKNVVFDNQRSVQENTSLLKQIGELEVEINSYKKTISEYESKINLTGTTNQALNLENNALSNLKNSLEDNRAHLRRQLMAREADISRLNVQIKNLNRKLDRSQMEIELLRESREKAGLSALKFPATSLNSLNQTNNNNNTSVVTSKQTTANNNNNTVKNIKLSKSHFSLEEVLADPIKTRLYIEKLNGQIKEKDLIVRNLNEVLSQRQVSEPVDSSSSDQIKTEKPDKSETEKLRKENDKLKNLIKIHEEKLKNVESKLKANKSISMTNLNIKKNSSLPPSRKSSSNSTNTNSNPNTSSDDVSSHIPIQTNNNSMQNIQSKLTLSTSFIEPQSESQTSIQRNKNFSEIELNNVRSRLQQRLNELEPLPELLKNTELKLREALTKLKTYETEITESRKIITDLKTQLETANVKINMAKESKISSLDHTKSMTSITSAPLNSADTNSKQQQAIIDKLNLNIKLDPVERRTQNLEDENRELIRQLGQKDELIRDLTHKLSVKSNEAASFSRQLDLALSDANIKEHQIREKYSTKERALQSRLSELETKLRSMELHSSVDRRDKDEMAQDYLTQIRDLKAKLEQTQLTNKQLQEYVNFLKNSYITYFNESTLHSFDCASSSSNFLSGNSSNFY